MAGETQMTVIGNLAADPELRYTHNGNGVANYTIASTPRFFDRQVNEWKDGETLWVRCTHWASQGGENAAESLSKGHRVIAHGNLKARSFETKEGEKRTVWELDVQEAGPSLQWHTAKPVKVHREGSGNSNGGGNTQQNSGGSQNNGNSDPWGNAGSDDGWGSSGSDDDAPF